MKAMIILIALVGFQFTSVFGGIIGEKTATIPSTKTSCEHTLLSPSIPMEATFIDSSNTNIQLSDLAPVVPLEADFTVEESQIPNHSTFAPVVPKEADFDESE
ncbi:MAG: hypothetical protein H8D88_01115 [Bacteroidetes bacterium]|nr:hypothetical protein [Bacteroidota bacterium]